MEIIAFMTGVMLSWPAFIILVIWGIMCEANGADGWTVFVGIVTALVAFFFFDVSLKMLALISVAYLCIGVAWSMWRYKRHLRKMVQDLKGKSETEISRTLSRARVDYFIGKITSWVLIWPFSVIENCIGDFIVLLQNSIKGIFERMYRSAESELGVDSKE